MRVCLGTGRENARRFLPIMSHLRTVAPCKDPKHASFAASKIKSKMFNISTFFKLSLKTNNKSLACALEAQKERSRQQEMKIMYLQKQLEMVNFELAEMNHKHRKLLLILKNLHSSTLHHLDMAADVLSDSELSKLSKDSKTCPVESIFENLHIKSHPEVEKQPTCPAQETLEKVLSATHAGSQNSLDICNGETDNGIRHSGPHIQTLLAGAPHQPRSLREEVEWLSAVNSQSGYDMSVLRPQTDQAPPVINFIDNTNAKLVNHPSDAVKEIVPVPGIAQESTLLLNSTMDITQSTASDIVTVETNTRKKDQKKAKSKQKDQNRESRLVDVKIMTESTERLNVATKSVLQTDYTPEDFTIPEDIDDWLSKTASVSGISFRIPKLTNAANRQYVSRWTQGKKPRDTDLDGCFTNKPQRKSGIRRKTFDIFPSPEGDGNPEPLLDDENPEATQDQQAHTQALYCAKEALNGETEYLGSPLSGANKPESKARNYDERHKSKKRGTFVVSLGMDSCATKDMYAEGFDAEQDLISTELDCEVEEPSKPKPAGVYLRSEHTDTHKNSDLVRAPPVGTCKRAWVASPGEGNLEEDFLSANHHELWHLDEDPLECVKPKKAKRGEKGRSKRKKVVPREDYDDFAPDNKTKGKRHSDNQRSEAMYRFCKPVSSKALLLHDTFPQDVGDKGDLPGLDSYCEPTEKHNALELISDSRPSELRMGSNPKQRKTSKLPLMLERKTFVVDRRKRQRINFYCDVRKSNVSDSVEVCPQSMGDDLQDEMPPWLIKDFSSTDAEDGSFLLTPKMLTLTNTSTRRMGEASNMAEASPARRVLSPLTNTISTPENQRQRRTKRQNVISYKEPSLNCKVRRGDKFTDCEFLSSPLFKDGKKKKKKKKKQ